MEQLVEIEYFLLKNFWISENIEIHCMSLFF